MADQPPEAADAARSVQPDALFDAVYHRLKTMAHQQLARHARGNTLDTTALVHELYLRINGQGELAFEHRGQFFAYAARATTRVTACASAQAATGCA